MDRHTYIDIHIHTLAHIHTYTNIFTRSYQYPHTSDCHSKSERRPLPQWSWSGLSLSIGSSLVWYFFLNRLHRLASHRRLFDRQRLLFICEEVTEDLAYRLSSHLLLHDHKRQSASSSDSTHTHLSRPDTSRLSTPQLGRSDDSPDILPGERPASAEEGERAILREREEGNFRYAWREDGQEEEEDYGAERARCREVVDGGKEGQEGGVSGVSKKTKRKREEEREAQGPVADDPFILLLNSPGGSLHAGLALVDVIQVSRMCLSHPLSFS